MDYICDTHRRRKAEYDIYFCYELFQMILLMTLVIAM